MSQRGPAIQTAQDGVIVSLTARGTDGTKCDQNSEANVARHPSVIKRHRQSLKRRRRNVETKSKLRTLIKKARQLIGNKDNKESASVQLRVVNKALDKAVSRGIIKRNTASRWISRLSRAASSS
jgi:small subunit ribosomal protein S20